MDLLKHISDIFNSSMEISFDDSSRIVIMSDCHRGNGSWSDEFMKNQNIYFAALTEYYNEKYTYIEMGDGDELWENKKLTEIIQIHSDAFWLLSRFYNEGRLYLIYGNHDMIKKDNNFVKDNLYQYYDEREKKYVPLFENVKVHEGLVLKYRFTGDKILLIHGHQADYFNSVMWKISRFLVRYLWKPLQTIGVNDPTAAAKNYKKKEAVGEKLAKWTLMENHMLVAGHTHRPVFPDIGEPPYFNDGSCVHPRCITAIEISFGYIMLVKWSVKTNIDNSLYIGRDVLSGPVWLKEYFNNISFK